MKSFSSLIDFKDVHKISDSKGKDISIIFKSIYEHYIFYNSNGPENINHLINQLINECMEVNATLIPYSEITNIIFSESHTYYDDNESSFAEEFKSKFEKHIIERFEEKKEEIDVELRSDIDIYSEPTYIHKKLVLNHDAEKAILVIYKIIQHAELAISQKKNLYHSLKQDIDSMNQTVYEASNKYDNMMSNFISILGIFAAIMMASFGAIQGFTAIFSSENSYSLSHIFIIASFGLFSLLSILFILLYSVSYLIDRSMESYEYPKTIFNRYPVYTYTVLLTFLIMTLSIVHHFKVAPPSYMPIFVTDNLWIISLLLLLLLIILYFIHTIIKRFNGYYLMNHSLENFIRSIKNKLSLKIVINLTVISIFVLIIGSVILLLFLLMR